MTVIIYRDISPNIDQVWAETICQKCAHDFTFGSFKSTRSQIETISDRAQCPLVVDMMSCFQSAGVCVCVYVCFDLFAQSDNVSTEIDITLVERRRLSVDHTRQAWSTQVAGGEHRRRGDRSAVGRPSPVCLPIRFLSLCPLSHMSSFCFHLHIVLVSSSSSSFSTEMVPLMRN